MRDDLTRIASTSTIGRDHIQGNIPLLGSGAAMITIRIDTMVSRDKDRIPALAPFHDERREFSILIDGMAAILF